MQHNMTKWFRALVGPNRYNPKKKSLTVFRRGNPLNPDALDLVENWFLNGIRSKASLHMPEDLNSVNYDRSDYIRRVMKCYSMWMSYLMEDKTQPASEVSRVKCSVDLYGNPMHDYVVKFHLKDSIYCSYVQVFAKLESVVKRTWLTDFIIKYFPKLYKPSKAKFTTRFVITSRIWIDPMSFYDVIIREVPICDSLITVIHNCFEGDNEYERRLRRLGPFRCLSEL